MRPLEDLDAAALRAALSAYLEALRAHRQVLNRMNVYPVPDADTGTNMTATMESVVEAARPAMDMPATGRAVAHGALMGARGISGVILSQVLRAFFERVGGRTAIGASDLADALVAASQAADTAVLRPVEGTMLTVVRAAAERALLVAETGGTPDDVLEAAASAARAAETRTPELVPALRSAGVEDAGGAGFVLFIDALLHVVTGKPLPDPPQPPPTLPARTAPAPGADERYEVVLLLEAADVAVPALREAWGRVGSAAVISGGDGLWRCHLHTQTPGEALDVAMGFGHPRDVHVTDLVGQVRKELGEALESQDDDVFTAVVAVGTGDGVRRLFRSLGANVVMGGRAMTPSVGELLDAVQAIAADAVVVLPNDEGVQPGAERLDGLTPKRVRVVGSRNLAEGLAALHAYDPDAPLEDNVAAMESAAHSVRSGEVVRAVGDSTGSVRIRAGEWLARTPEGLASVAPTLLEAARDLLERLTADEAEVLTVLEGEGSNPRTTDALLDWLDSASPGVGVQILWGGQPLHPYVFSAQ